MSSIQETLQKRIEKAGLQGSHKITFKKGFHKDGLVFPKEDTKYTIKGKECGKEEILKILKTDNLCPFYNFGINGETGQMFSLYSYFYYFEKILEQEKFTQGTNCDMDITLNLKDNREQVIEKVKFSFQELFMNNCSLPTEISKGMSKSVFALNVPPVPVPIFLDDGRAIDLIRFMQHKFKAVDYFLREMPLLKVIIPADYLFYFEEKKGEFTAYEEEINKVMNKNIYSNKLKFNLVMGHFKYNIILDIKSFRGNQTNLTTGKVREIRIGFKQETNLGKGLAIKQWKTAFGDTKRYEEFITKLDENVRMLYKKYDTRVVFGTLNNKLNNKNILQLWGANMKNYDSETVNGFIIKGSGQAGYLGRHSVSTFGIVTTPAGGAPTLEDMGERLYYRNTGKLTTKPMGAMGSMGASAMGAMGSMGASAMSSMGSMGASAMGSMGAMGASVMGSMGAMGASVMGAMGSPAVIKDPFKYCDKTKDDPLTERKPGDFISNLIKGNRASMKIAVKELSKGTKTKHWVWAIFPQPLNVYDTLSKSIYPTVNSIKNGFNSYIEVELFLMTPELVYNYTVCLELLLKAMTTKKPLRHILGDDNVKVISSVKYINKAIERFLSLNPTARKINISEILKLQKLIQIFLTTIDRGIVLGRKISKKNKKSKNKKKKSKNKKYNI